MRQLIFLALLFFVTSPAYPQTNYNGLYYYQGIAGDTTKPIGKISKAHLGDTLTSDHYLRAGLYRLITHPDIDRDLLKLRIIHEQGQELALTKHDTYIEFYNPSRGTLRFITDTNQILEEEVEVIGRLFWVYSKNMDREAPSFTLTDLEGNTYTNESLRNKVVVINFWGTQCAPCVREIPQLNRLVQQYAERDDVVFLGISPDTEEKLQKFLERRPFDYQLISAEKFTELEEKFSDVPGSPSHFVLNKEGKLVFQFFGESARMEKMLVDCINHHL